MHASFRGRKGGVDWDKKELANVVTELQLETPQYSDESTLYMNQTGQVRATMAVLIQLFVVLTGLNEHNTWWVSLSPQHLSDSSVRGQSNMTLLSPPAPKTEMQEITSM